MPCHGKSATDEPHFTRLPDTIAHQLPDGPRLCAAVGFGTGRGDGAGRGHDCGAGAACQAVPCEKDLTRGYLLEESVVFSGLAGLYAGTRSSLCLSRLLPCNHCRNLICRARNLHALKMFDFGATCYEQKRPGGVARKYHFRSGRTFNDCLARRLCTSGRRRGCTTRRHPTVAAHRVHGTTFAHRWQRPLCG